MLTQEKRTLVLLPVALIALASLAFVVWMLSREMSGRIERSETQGVPPALTGDGPFVAAWSVPLDPPLVHEMAPSPVRRGEFFALDRNKILRFAANGTRLGEFAAPPKSLRITSDPTGSVPYLIVTSQKTKWTGAIDYVVTTDYFVEALDTLGHVVWKKRIDPKAGSTPEPVIARLKGAPVILLSTGQRIFCLDSRGAELWNIQFSHHPGTVAPLDLDGGTILAAQTPMGDIVRIDSDGKLIASWAKGDGPRRFRMMKSGERLFGISVRQVFGRGQGVRQALTFFDELGTSIREVELPPDASLLTYSPIATIDVDGSGQRQWLLGLGDGTILVFSPTGEELARQSAGVRMRTLISVTQENGDDVLITSTYRGLTGWLPMPDRMNRRSSVN